MSKGEHLLMIALFTKQAQFIKTIVQILTSRKIIEQDDAQAFEFAVALDAESNLELFEQARIAYVKLAKGLGIETGLESSG